LLIQQLAAMPVEGRALEPGTQKTLL
jgi:hypothetical protein